ncbi:MAG: dihydropteroate synthase [Streptosporangiales bacterium]
MGSDPAPGSPLHLGRRVFPPGQPVIMAIVNRTPDSFFDRGRTYAFGAALDRVDQVVAEGAPIVDIGGVKAGAGAEVTVAEEVARVVPLVAAVRERYPDLVISVDTYRAAAADPMCRAGADLINDAWAGWDPRLAEVAARHATGLVCAHTGGRLPRTPPRPIAYADVVADVIAAVTALAERAVALGVRPQSILIDAAHDFGKDTAQSLELTRRLDEVVATGWPVLVALSRKDFLGDVLGLPATQRLEGSLAAATVSAWLGARVVRAHDVEATRRALQVVAALGGQVARTGHRASVKAVKLAVVAGCQRCGGRVVAGRATELG